MECESPPVDPHVLLSKMSGCYYSDVGWLDGEQLELAWRGRSFEIHRQRFRGLSCRAIVSGRGYGVATGDFPSRKVAMDLPARAMKSSSSCKIPVKLSDAPTEAGRARIGRGRFGIDEGMSLLECMTSHSDRFSDSGKFLAEAVLTFERRDCLLVTSQGSDVGQSFRSTTLVAQVVTKEEGMGFASMAVGGCGGREVLRRLHPELAMEDLWTRARDMARASSLPPSLAGRRYAVVFDEVLSGALAHEAAHLLEADVYSHATSPRPNGLLEEVVLVDDPLIEGAYGSFAWDDEAVRARRKTLLDRSGLELLGCRWTGGNAWAGNARGMMQMPRPGISNVHFQAGDWREDEMIKDARRCMVARGLVSAHCDTSAGTVTILPEVCYLESKSSSRPIRGIRLQATASEFLASIDAVGRDLVLTPNAEKGFPISQGGPPIRLGKIRCW